MKKHKGMKFHDNINLWAEYDDAVVKSFVGAVQLFDAKTATKLETTTILAFPIRSIVLNFAARRWQKLIGNTHTLVRFVLVCRSDE